MTDYADYEVISDPLQKVGKTSVIGLAGALGACAPIILLAMAIIIGGRTRELGVLKAIGATDRQVVAQYAVKVTVILGPSGSGKTTLLYLIGSLENPDAGEIKVFGKNICDPGADLIEYRRERVGFVFQFFNLVTALTALENVTLAMDLASIPAQEQRRRAADLLERMGIDGRLTPRE